MSEALLGVLIGGGIGFAGSYVVARVANRGENERLERQLKHERTLREREELRTVIDRAMQTAQDGVYAAAEMNTALSNAKATNRDDAEAVYARTRAELREIEQRLNGHQSQLAVRLAVGNPLADAVKECREQLGVFRMLAAPGVPQALPIDRPTIRELTSVLDEATHRVEEFERKAVAYAGSELGTEQEQIEAANPQ